MAKLTFQIEGDVVEHFRVVRYCGVEGLCQLYRFEIEVVSDDNDALPSIMGKPGAKLGIDPPYGKNCSPGFVSRAERLGDSGGRPNLTYYRLELMPKIWLLTQRYNSRIFQNKTVKEIITDILDKAKLDP